jgi:hypothetical protein
LREEIRETSLGNKVNSAAVQVLKLWVCSKNTAAARRIAANFHKGWVIVVGTWKSSNRFLAIKICIMVNLLIKQRNNNPRLKYCHEFVDVWHVLTLSCKLIINQITIYWKIVLILIKCHWFVKLYCFVFLRFSNSCLICQNNKQQITWSKFNIYTYKAAFRVCVWLYVKRVPKITRFFKLHIFCSHILTPRQFFFHFAILLG